MAEMDVRIIPEFDGTGPTPVGEWWDKAVMVCKLRGMKDLEKIIPLRLTGGAFAVYQQLGDEAKGKTDSIKDALLAAFAQDKFAAYEQFVSRRLRPGEAVDVYLADLRRLAALFDGVSDTALACAFTAGLPDTVRHILRAGSRMEALSLVDLLARARSIMADEGYGPGVAAAAVGRGACADGRRHAPHGYRGAGGSGGSGGGPAPQSAGRSLAPPAGASGQRAGGGGLLCYVCNGPNHLARDCLQRSRRNQNGGQRGYGRCYRCGMGGHNASACQGNDTGEESAPASSPDCR